MTAVFLTHSWRARWRALVALAVMVGLVGGLTIAAVAGARRSASALPRFQDAAETLDVFVSADLTPPEPAAMRALLDGPLVERTNDLVFVFVDVDAVGVVFAPTSRRGLSVEQGVLVDGRRADPDAPDEVTLSETTARDLGLGVGDVFEAGTLAPEQVDELFSTGAVPTSLDGPAMRLDVVGTTRTGFDLGSQGADTGLTITTPAFWERHGADIGVGSTSHMVRLVEAPNAVERFTEAVAAAYGGERLPSINVGQGEDSVADTISVATAALLAAALVVALAGTAWVGSAVARHQRLVAHDVEVLRALGATATERRIVLVGSVAPALGGGVVLASVLAIALSPLFPVGLARDLDPSLGVHADLVVLVAGSLALAAVLLGIATVAAAQLARHRTVTRPRPSEARVPRLVDRTARALGPAGATGVRFALHAPRQASTPVRPALVGAVLGVVGLAAVAVVGASLQRLVDSPERWGTTWDVAVRAEHFAAEPTGPEEEVVPDREALAADPDVGAAAIVLYDEQVTVDGVEAIAMTFEPVKGDLTPTVVEGREPRADDEVALARDTFNAVGVELGDQVRVVSRGQRSGVYRIVGVIAFPTIGEPTAVATGATLTAAGGDRLLLGSGGDDVGARYVALRWAPGVDHQAALDERGIELTPGAFETVAVEPTAPPEIDGLQAVRGFPLLVGGVLVLLGAAATTHALLVTVRRRRLELGVLSALGFAPGQRRAVIRGQATTIAIVALALGLPLGAVVGRMVWSAIAGAMGVGAEASFPLVVLAAGAAALVLGLNAVAALPGRAARRLHVAEALRSE